MFAVIYIPNFSLQAVLRVEPNLRAKPVALFDTEMTKSVICQFTATARAYGVNEGMTPSQGAARCAELLIRSRSSVQEKSATDTLLQTAYAFSPNIEATAPGICTLQLKGLSANSSSCAEKIRRMLESFYLDSQIGFAKTPELALIAAKSAQPVLVLNTQGNETSLFENFPIAALEPLPETATILFRWGIRTVGEFLALDKDSIAGRLGPAALSLFDRASATVVRPLKLVTPPEEFIEEMEFEHEIDSTQPLLFALRRFVEQLSRRFEMIYLVVAEFQLRLGLASGETYERTFKIPAPTGNVSTLFRMLETHLEGVRTDSPITSLRLAALPATPETHQFGLFESTLRNPNQFGETLARLTALFGADRVGTPELIPAIRPDSFCMVLPNFDKQVNMEEFTISSNTGVTLRRFRPPLSAEFQIEGPTVLRNEIFSGPIKEVRGPFLSSGDWWEKRNWSRKEWDIETLDGQLLRIFKSGEDCFVEGVYD